MEEELPPRVAPADGTEVYDFPWTEAAGLFAAMRSAALMLSDHLLSQRPGLDPDLEEWRGRYRADFNTAFSEKVTHAQDLQQRLTSRANAIWDAADAANRVQQRLNEGGSMPAVAPGLAGTRF